MGGLLGLLELLGLSGLNHEQAATLTVARESGRALLRIIDDILDFSKIEANAIELNLVAASVAQVVGNACRLHSQIAATKNLALRMDVAPQISPFLSFDPLRLTQILNNFLSNAIKFTAYGSVDILVDLEARGEGTERLKFVVRDTGIGVSAEQQERLFNPFVQAGSATSTHFGGTGLGLVISRRLAELMGGTVAMNSEEGKGTTMTLSVAFEICELDPTLRPREMTDGEVLDALTANRRKPPSKEVAEDEGTLLLVVDDHPTNRMVITRQVASLGYASEEAVDGMQALKAWESGRFGAIITDCNMPRMNGYELTAAIRSHEAETGKSRIPIIACTANAMAAAKQLCLDSGMDDCLVKPADLTDVARKLDLWLPLANIAAQARPVATVQPQKLTLVPTKAEGLLDLALLAEISGGDFQVQTEIIADFRSVTEVDVQALRDAVVKGNTTQVIASAHRIKGAGLMLGATLLSNACGALETAAASVNHSRLLEDLGTFEMELLRLSQFLDAFSASNET